MMNPTSPYPNAGLRSLCLSLAYAGMQAQRAGDLAMWDPDIQVEIEDAAIGIYFDCDDSLDVIRARLLNMTWGEFIETQAPREQARLRVLTEDKIIQSWEVRS